MQHNQNPGLRQHDPVVAPDEAGRYSFHYSDPAFNSGYSISSYEFPAYPHHASQYIAYAQ